jgi:ligand-binding sensor domain-containing protein/signal transduction histidine kinase
MKKCINDPSGVLLCYRQVTLWFNFEWVSKQTNAYIHIRISAIAMFCIFFQIRPAIAQQKIFNKELSKELSSAGLIITIAQDRQGYMWFGSQAGGLLKYDGKSLTAFNNKPGNDNSLANNWVEAIVIDTNNIIWAGTLAGVDKYDQVTNRFTHFRHNPRDETSLSSDTITAMLQDRSGMIWVGTHNGLNRLDPQTGKFTHYYSKVNDPTSLSYNDVRVLYEDRKGTVWIGCGSAFAADGGKPEDGGLNRFNNTTNTFTRYLHDPANPGSLENNKVKAILEDNKGNFWIGTAGDGLHILDRASGKFTHYYYDAAFPEKLSRPPASHRDASLDHITFIHEDAKGYIWIGTQRGGINQYDPLSKRVTHHGLMRLQSESIVADTLSGFNNINPWQAFTSKDGLLWIGARGEVYTVNPIEKQMLPYVKIRAPGANSFFEAPDGTLWVATEKGLAHFDTAGKQDKLFLNDPANINSLSHNVINSIRVDKNGMFWLGTLGGLNKFDPSTGQFTRYLNDSTKTESLSSNLIYTLFFDSNRDLWLGTDGGGLNQMNSKTGHFTAYKHDKNLDNTLTHNTINAITEDTEYFLWVGTQKGLNRLNKKNGHIKRYLPDTLIVSLYTDDEGMLWVGSPEGLFSYEKSKDRFLPYSANNIFTPIDKVLGIIEDNQKSLWVSTSNDIYQISPDRKSVRIFGEENGVHPNLFGFCDNHTSASGKLYLGDQGGFYSFYPNQLRGSSSPPQINLTSFHIGEKELKYDGEGILREPLYQLKEISLPHTQNTFSIGFWAIQYVSISKAKYQYMLQNYDNIWHTAGSENKAYFFNIPPGDYTFRVRAMNSDGVWQEKTLSVVISPPWWKTWWAITFFALSFIALISAVFYYRSRQLRRENRLLEEKVSQRTAEVLQQKEEISAQRDNLERTLSTLKATQNQLIQAEKMASLGELTAGIAHEIQNPLNFVNNFSEVSEELCNEIEEEVKVGNSPNILSLTADLKGNLQKIHHHGKRADSIVKGMLQHSRASSGEKQLTDINALVDEYLRLAYHGLRAKEKDFNAELITDFDSSLSKVEVVPQEIGRVLLNLFNNAFYATQQKKAQLNGQYHPQVSVTTKALANKIEIRVKDNGTGIPESVRHKIFQPFFTTKPTGEGTGLGLSLSYDIITKGHGGELNVESEEGVFTEFSIRLPTNK